MATNSELRKQIDLLISSLDKLGVNTDKFKKKLSEAGKEEEKLVELMDEMVNALDRADNSASSLYQTLQAISDELGGSNKFLNRTKGLFSKITDDARKLRDDEQGITDLSKQQLLAIQRRYKTNSKYLKEQRAGLKEEKRKLEEKAKTEKGLSAAEQKRLEQYDAAIKMAKDEDNFVAELNDKIEDRLDLEKLISKQMGVTGALVQGTGALMERLGMRSGIFHDAMAEANNEMRFMAKQIEDGQARFSKLEIAAKGFSIVARGFGQALFDPAVLISGIVSKFFELNAASTKLQRLTGQNAGIQAAHNNSLASGAQIMGLMAEMTERTGVAASAMFSSEDLGRLAEAQNLLGLSAEQASNLGLLSKVSGTSIQGYKEDIVDSVNSFNAMNNSAVAHGVIMKDVLEASADISTSLGGNPKKIAAAAAAARKLGSDLAKVNQIADGLLDFESSIATELEAQLLTGKQINLNKARELALNNDLEGLANELAKNGASAAEFAKMNRIQQQALAQALGMSREEMGKILIAQKGQENLSREQIAAMRGVTLEQLEQMEAAESLQLAFSKIAEPLASILNTLAPIITQIAKLVAFVAPVAPYIYLAVKGAKLFGLNLRGSVRSMSELLTKTKLFGKFYKGGQFLPGGGKAKAGGERAGGLLSGFLGNSKPITPDAGKSTGKGIESVSSSIAKIDMKKVLQGAAAMALVAGSLYVFGKAVQQFSEVSWGDVGKAVVGMFALVGAVAVLGAIMMSGYGAVAILAGAAAMLVMGGAVMVLGLGVQMLADGFNSMIPNLMGLTKMIPELFQVADALDSIGNGLIKIAAAGILAIPALMVVSTLSESQSTESDGFSRLEAKMDKLIAAVQAGGNVYLDGNRVGEATVLGTYKLE